MSERRFTMTAGDFLTAQAAVTEIHSIIVNANRRSCAVQAALGLAHGLPGLTFHGALDKINRAIAAMNKAEEYDA